VNGAGPPKPVHRAGNRGALEVARTGRGVAFTTASLSDINWKASEQRIAAGAPGESSVVGEQKGNLFLRWCERRRQLPYIVWKFGHRPEDSVEGTETPDTGAWQMYLSGMAEDGNSMRIRPRDGAGIDLISGGDSARGGLKWRWLHERKGTPLNEPLATAAHTLPDLLRHCLLRRNAAHPVGKPKLGVLAS